MSKKEENGIVDPYSDDELDNWYTEPEEDDEEDQSADEDWDNEESASIPEEDQDSTPDEEVPDDGGDDTPPEEGTQDQEPEQPAPKKDDPYAWVSNLDPEFKQKVEALVHSDQSNRGRVAAYQRRLDRLEAEQEAQRRRASQPAATPAVDKGNVDVEDLDDDLKAFVQEYPAMATNVRKLAALEAQRAREAVRREYEPYLQKADADRRSEAKEQLRRNAYDIFNAAETGVELEDVLGSPRFVDWIRSQSEGYRKFAQQANSVEDATKVLEDFAAWSDQVLYSEWQRQQEQAGEPADMTSDERRQKADSVSARRKDALKGTTPKSKSAQTRTSGADDDYEALFNAFAEGTIS